MRVHGQHVGVARRLRRPGRPAGTRASCRGTASSLGKLAQSLAYGARTLAGPRRFRRLPAPGRCRERAARRLPRSTRSIRSGIEGQKTIVLELLQQLGWDPPDWIVLPAGNLGNTAAFGKALREAREWGLITRHAATGGRAGGGRRAVRAELRGGIRQAAHRQGGNGRHRHPDRQPRVVRSRGAGHPRDRRRGAGGDATRS